MNATLGQLSVIALSHPDGGQLIKISEEEAELGATSLISSTWWSFQPQKWVRPSGKEGGPRWSPGSTGPLEEGVGKEAREGN